MRRRAGIPGSAVAVVVIVCFAVGSDRPASAEPLPSVPVTAQVVDWGNDTCLGCHAEPGITTVLPSGEIRDDTVDAERWEMSVHAFWDMKCILCHTEITEIPHEPPMMRGPRAYTIAKSDACLTCHREKEIIEDSVHTELREAGNEQAAVCSDCHNPHYTTDPPMDHSDGPETCRTCHAEIYDRYEESVHGAALTDGNTDVPTCTDCHGVHQIEGPDLDGGGEFHLFSTEICATCHADEALMAEYGINTDVFNTYVADFHGRTITLFQELTPDQQTNAPVCVSCHGIHDIKSADDPDSTVAKENLLVTCQQCHPDATTDFPDAWMSHYSATPDQWPIVFLVRLFYMILIPVVIGGMIIYVLLDIVGRWRRRKKKEAASV